MTEYGLQLKRESGFFLFYLNGDMWYCLNKIIEKEKILFALRMLKIQIILHPYKYKYRVDDIEELIVIVNYEKWKFEH